MFVQTKFSKVAKMEANKSSFVFVNVLSRGGAPGAAGVVLKDHCFVDVAVRDGAVYGLSRSCAGPGAELGAVLSTTFVGGCQCDAGERRRCRGGTDSRGGARSPC